MVSTWPFNRQITLFEFSLTWSCVSLTRSTTSSEWKLFTSDSMEGNCFQILLIDVTEGGSCCDEGVEQLKCYCPGYQIPDWWMWNTANPRDAQVNLPIANSRQQLLCKAKRRYLLTWKVSRYRLLTLRGIAQQWFNMSLTTVQHCWTSVGPMLLPSILPNHSVYIPSNHELVFSALFQVCNYCSSSR